MCVCPTAIFQMFSIFFQFTNFNFKMRFRHECFPVNFAKVLKATFFIEQLCLATSERTYNQKIYALALTNGYKKFYK